MTRIRDDQTQGHSQSAAHQMHHSHDLCQCIEAIGAVPFFDVVMNSDLVGAAKRDRAGNIPVPQVGRAEPVACRGMTSKSITWIDRLLRK